MAAFSNNGVYVISFTDVTKGTISIPKDALISDRFDITLIGKSRLEYGEIFDENVLHLVENFASYQDPSPAIVGTIQPDLSQSTSPLLQTPTEGQFWYNKGKRSGNSIDVTNKGLYTYSTSGTWNVIKMRGDVAGNSGIIAHGQQIPLPDGISTYAECSWFVSPQSVDEQSNYIACYADGNAHVTALYRPITQSVPVQGLANYIIFGQKTSKQHYYPIVSVTPTLTPAMVQSLTPTITPSPTSTPAPAVSVTPTPSVTPSVTPSATPTRTVTPTVTRTITPTFSPTPSPTPITYQTFILNAVFNNTSPGLSYVEYGYVRSFDASVNFGSITPVIYNGYFIGACECFSLRNTPPTFSFNIRQQINAIAGAPKTAFTKINFVDKFGILREFTAATANYTSNGYFSWPIPSLLFDAGQTYQILITP
jgi:hypothetical protein